MAEKPIDKSKTYKIIMVRHGESEWNQKNLYCGWYDANLSEKGKEEAIAAGKALKEAGYIFDIAHTSVLTRALKTLESILKEIGQYDVPIEKSWRLNERHYGGLTGLNKAEIASKYGEEQAALWRHGFDAAPPAIEEDNQYYEAIVKDERYQNKSGEMPLFESLKLTIERTLPYWFEVIVPQIKEGKTILIVAHGNSLRGIIKHLDDMSDEDIMGLNLPSGVPFVYELDESMKPTPGGSLKFLGDDETVKKAIAAISSSGKTN